MTNDDKPESSSNNETPPPLLSLEERWSEERFQEMAGLWKLSDKDQTKMRQLRYRLVDVGDYWKNDPFHVVRYYSEYHGNLKQTEKMFRKMVAWRIDNRMDSFLERYGEPDPLLRQMPIAVLNTTDRDGDPIYVDRMGVSDSWNLLQHFGLEAMTDYIVYLREINHSHPPFWDHYEQQHGRKVQKENLIFDLQGLNKHHIRPLIFKFVRITGRISQDMYAGWGKRIFVLRAPPIFKTIWNMIKHCFDKHIQQMIVFTTPTDYLQVMEQYIELESLPPCLAPGIGKATAMPGTYFEKVSLEGGPLDLTKSGENNNNNNDNNNVSNPEQQQSPTAEVVGAAVQLDGSSCSGHLPNEETTRPEVPVRASTSSSCT